MLSTSIFALHINESLLKVHATLVPKISLMDYKFSEKLKNNTITIAIMYNKSEYKDAKFLKDKIDTRYQNGIQSYKVKSKLVLYSNVKQAQANVYYLFPTSEHNIIRTIEQAQENSALTFSYLQDDLKYGVMISLNIGNKIKPVLNLEAIKMYNIALRPVLLDISSIYMHEPYSALESYKIRGLYNFMQYMA
jgi:hypothetical protein